MIELFDSASKTYKISYAFCACKHSFKSFQSPKYMAIEAILTPETVFSCLSTLVYFPQYSVRFGVDLCSCFCFLLCFSSWQTASLCLHWPFCGNHWHFWADTSHLLPSAACHLTLSLCLTLPVFCIASSPLHVSCQLCFAILSLLGSPESHFLQ